MLEVEPTPGEKLFLLRKRAGLTAEQMWPRFKVGKDRYLLWEKDRFHGVPVVNIGELSELEKCILLRRRYKIGVVQVSEESGIRVDLVMSMENGYTEPSRLIEYWRKKTSDRAAE